MYCNFCMRKIEESDMECPFCGNSVDYDVPAHHLMPGTVLRDRYLVGAALGEGGFGITYIGMDTTLKMRIAIKEYYPNGFVNRNNTAAAAVTGSTTEDRKEFFDQGKEKFLKEAQILASFCGKPGIVEVRDFFEENNTAYIVMEYLDGETLKEYIKETGRLAPKKALELLLPIMESLKQIHKQGIIHRDISPDNIMLIDGKAKLLDFGSARVFSNDNKSLSVMVKPGYAPPEQYGKKGKQGPWTDIYALCATMYKCITGITPDDASDRLLSDQVKSPSALGIEIDEAFEHALMKGMAVQFVDRYQNIDDLLNGFNGKISAVNDDDSKTVYNPQSRTATSADDEKTELLVDSGKESAPVPEAANNTNSTEAKNVGSMPSKPEKSVNSLNEDAQVKEAPKNPTVELPKKRALNTVGRKAPARKKSKKIFAISASACAVCAAVVLSVIFLPKILPESITSSDSSSISSYTSSKPQTMSSVSSDSISSGSQITSSGSNYSTLVKEHYNAIDGVLYLYGQDITDNMLNQMIPEIQNLKFLTKLNLGGNKITDISPLANLTNLMELKLSFNQIIDISPLAGLTNLTNLELDYNQISEISPLTNLSNLTCLNLMENKVSDISPIAGLTSLTKLDLSGNKVSDISSLVNLSGLTKLNLVGNEISDISSIANFTNLTQLKLSFNQISNIGSLTRLINLTDLDLEKNQISDISHLSALTNLISLNLENNQISDISYLSALTNLTELDLENNQISETSSLAGLINLTELHLSQNPVNNINHLERLTKLNYLYIWSTPINNLSVITNLTSLKSLSADFEQVENNLSILSNHPCLTRLWVYGLRISDENKTMLRESLPNITINF